MKWKAKIMKGSRRQILMDSQRLPQPKSNFVQIKSLIPKLHENLGGKVQDNVKTSVKCRIDLWTSKIVQIFPKNLREKWKIVIIFRVNDARKVPEGKPAPWSLEINILDEFKRSLQRTPNYQNHENHFLFCFQMITYLFYFTEWCKKRKEETSSLIEKA